MNRNMPRTPDRESQTERPLGDVTREVTVRPRPFRRGIDDVEGLVVRPTREPNAQPMPHGAVCPIAAAKVRPRPRFPRRRPCEASHARRRPACVNPISSVFHSTAWSTARSRSAEQPFVVVLREAEGERERA